MAKNSKLTKDMKELLDKVSDFDDGTNSRGWSGYKPPKKMSKCEWNIDEKRVHRYTYSTSCGVKGALFHREYLYCPYCGRIIRKYGLKDEK